MRRRAFLVGLAALGVAPVTLGVAPVTLGVAPVTLGAAPATLGAALAGAAQGRPKATMYKTPNCGCCEEYATYLRGHGYPVATIDSQDMDALRAQHRIPQNLQGCHTTLVGGYVVEGHVPVAAIDRLLRERPRIRGISLPGMPQGSPGMSGRKTEPFRILEIATRASSEPRLFALE